MAEASTYSAAALIGCPVADVHGISIGLTADVLADRSLAGVLGFEVETPRQRAFLPFAACSVDGERGEITIAAALSLLGSGELDYYESRGVSLARLRATATAADFLLDERGRIAAVLLERPAPEVEVLSEIPSGRTESVSAESTMALPLERR